MASGIGDKPIEADRAACVELQRRLADAEYHRTLAEPPSLGCVVD